MFETEIGEFLNLLGENIAAAPTDTLEDNHVHAIHANEIITSIKPDQTSQEPHDFAIWSSNLNSQLYSYNFALMR